MRTLSKLILAFALAAIVLAGSANAQSMKIGYVDDQKILQGMEEYVRAQDQWNIEQKAWEDESTSKQDELMQMIDEYEKQKLILSEEKKLEREAAIRTKQEGLDAFTRSIYGPGGTAEKKQMELLVPIQEKVNRAIQLVSEEGGYDIVFTAQSSLAYIKPTFEITDKVIAQIEKLEN